MDTRAARLTASKSPAGTPRIATSDRPEMHDLHRSHHQRMVKLATLLMGSSSAAVAVVHASFDELKRNWHRIDDPPAALRRTVVNRCRALEHEAIKDEFRHTGGGSLTRTDLASEFSLFERADSLVGEPPARRPRRRDLR